MVRPPPQVSGAQTVTCWRGTGRQAHSHMRGTQAGGYMEALGREPRRDYDAFWLDHVVQAIQPEGLVQVQMPGCISKLGAEAGLHKRQGITLLSPVGCEPKQESLTVCSIFPIRPGLVSRREAAHLQDYLQHLFVPVEVRQEAVETATLSLAGLPGAITVFFSVLNVASPLVRPQSNQATRLPFSDYHSCHCKPPPPRESPAEAPT